MASVAAKPGVDVAGINRDLLSRYASYNEELGNPFTIVSGKRSLAHQALLYSMYLAGTGNLAAKPTPNAPHVLGYAIDHSPGTQGKAPRFMSMARKHGLKYPVPGEDWHVEPIRRVANYSVGGQHAPPMALGGVLPIIEAAMARGGVIIGPKPGGVNLKVGEVGQSEKVQVVPLNGSGSDGGGNVNHFYGELVFPNIRTPEDAEGFIANLESLGT
jgi:hypothetical protein